MEIDVDGQDQPRVAEPARQSTSHADVSIARIAKCMVMCCALVATLIGCNAPPQPGDPCEPGDPLVTFMPRNEEELLRLCRLSSGSGGTCSLGCTGPPGCDGEATFEWAWATSNYHWTWCGCDGLTHSPVEDDDGSAGLPSTRWQWWGTCEEPCFGVSLGAAGWGWLPEGFGPGGGGVAPVAPQCTRCVGARLSGEECVGADGATVSLDCCAQCANAATTSDGCVDSVAGTALSPYCCG